MADSTDCRTTRGELATLAASVFIDAHGHAHMTGDQWRHLHEIASAGLAEIERLRAGLQLALASDTNEERGRVLLKTLRESDAARGVHTPAPTEEGA